MIIRICAKRISVCRLVFILVFSLGEPLVVLAHEASTLHRELEAQEAKCPGEQAAQSAEEPPQEGDVPDLPVDYSGGQPAETSLPESWSIPQTPTRMSFGGNVMLDHV